MIYGKVKEFIEHIRHGDEHIFLYDGKKYFLQGYLSVGKCTLYLDRWQPPSGDYIWVGVGNENMYPVNEFVEAKLWNGKSFFEIEQQIEWVDE